MQLRTYDSGLLTGPLSVTFGDPVFDGAEEGVGAGADELCCDAPTTPPITAARIMMIRISARIIQKSRRRRPNILFSVGLAETTVDAAEVRLGRAKSLASASARDAFSASTYLSVISLTRVSN